ncbi:GNAT family N-acetyltransferase [Aquihabitans sp. G128]|uniref:GNAT family N-acetyltransferase n=1 Tax=Aquihabitans sp. G128 TaxID=2849779 RepID=UPI001C24C601|nr:GNAT family N-acetyltransferase [Aquihabitans sp. G128]QXC61922.1 GNAT family N-acetyltransferase [Aquihabitans sp. G128]
MARLRWDWRIDAGEVPPSTLAAFTADLGDWLDDHAETHLGFVAEVDGEVVGIAFLAVVERVPGPGVWDRRSGYVQSVYVDPAHRGHGLGRRLVDAVVGEAGTGGLQYVSVHPSERSFPLYERAGFVRNGRTLQLRF